MKNLFALLLAACVMLSCAACGGDAPAETTAVTTAPTETQAAVSYAVPGEADMPVSEPEVDWGLTLTAEKVTANGLTIRYTQSGGAPTGELSTGSYFTLEVFDGQWKEVEMLPQEFEIVWNDIAYLIAMEGETELPEDWSFLYGPTKPGFYRIGKEIMDFRGPGDYDTAYFYAYFEITP